MRPDLVIFDLDGTLADSYPWFLRHANDVADRFGFRRIATDDVEALRHAGSRDILRRLDVPLWKLPAIARHLRRLKAASLGEIGLFAGVDTMLRALDGNGVRLALVSSDHEANARAQLGAALFGKPQKFRTVLRRAGVEPGRAVAIGDEVRDIEAARSAGIACGAVTWGYAAPAALRARRPDVIIERMEEIAPALLVQAIINHSRSY